MITAFDKVSTATLEDTPRRALELIRGIGGSPDVMRALSSAGYTPRDHDEGIRLLNGVLSYVARPLPVRLSRAVSASSAPTPSFGAAVKEIKRWVKTDFRRIRVGLRRFFPEQADYLFSGLDVSEMLDAVALSEIFLQRITALTTSAERKTTRKTDRAALAMIEARGITRTSLEHLRARVMEAHATPDVPVEPPTPEADGRLEALTALRAWYVDWAETARIVLSRRDHLIRLGLATRKPRSDSQEA
jgi:hypothetical protein